MDICIKLETKYIHNRGLLLITNLAVDLLISTNLCQHLGAPRNHLPCLLAITSLPKRVVLWCTWTSLRPSWSFHVILVLTFHLLHRFSHTVILSNQLELVAAASHVWKGFISHSFCLCWCSLHAGTGLLCVHTNIINFKSSWKKANTSSQFLSSIPIWHSEILFAANLGVYLCTFFPGINQNRSMMGLQRGDTHLQDGEGQKFSISWEGWQWGSFQKWGCDGVPE